MSAEYTLELGHCLGFIDSGIVNGTETIIPGNTNFECKLSNSSYKVCRDTSIDHCKSCCDDLIMSSTIRLL